MADETKKTPPTVEIAGIAADPTVPLYSTTLQPRDEVLARRGGAAGLRVYDEIRRDPHAHAVLQKRTLEVVARPWVVREASDSAIDKRAADLVRRQFDGFAFDRATMGLMGAVPKGFAVGEVMWDLRDGEWTVDRIKIRRQQRFRFAVDGSLRLLTRANGIDGEAVPDRKFVIHRYSIEHDDDDPYGLGLGSVLFWPAWFKRQVLSYWLRASEKYATPTIKAQYSGGYDEKRQQEILAVIRGLANDAGIVVPEDVLIEFLESKSAAGTMHDPLARYLDELMSEAVLGETLSTNSGQRGARALGEVHNDVRLAIAKADADLVSATLNESLVRWIVEINLPGAKPPTVWRDFEEVEDLNTRAERDKKIADMGFKPTLAYVTETYGGEWIESSPPTPPAAPDIPLRRGVTDALFADNAAATPPTPTDPIVQQLAVTAQPILDRMIGIIREQVMAATSADDLAERLLSVLPALDPSDLTDVLEAAMTLADLTGRAAIVDETGGA